MAENTTPATDAADKPSMMPKIMILGFVSVIIIAETLIFFLLVPSADDVAALAEARLIDRVEKNMKKDDDKVIDDPEAIKEFPLGEHSVTFTPPGSDRAYRVEFRLFGTVRDKNLEKLERIYAERQGRFSNRMMLEVRNATMDELTENQLGLLQRRILATSNEILDDDNPILLGVGFNDYDLIEE